MRALRTAREIAEGELLEARIELGRTERAKDQAVSAYGQAYLREKRARAALDALVDVAEGARP